MRRRERERAEAQERKIGTKLQAEIDRQRAAETKRQRAADDERAWADGPSSRQYKRVLEYLSRYGIR